MELSGNSKRTQTANSNWQKIKIYHARSHAFLKSFTRMEQSFKIDMST